MTQETWLPKYAFLTRGVGQGYHPIAAFDAALCEAGVSSQNLVLVSSVFPSGCQLLSREDGLSMLVPGQVTFCVMARHDSRDPGKLIVSAVGLVIPKTKMPYGYLAEYHAENQDESTAAREAEQLARTLLSAKMGRPIKDIGVESQQSIALATSVGNGGEWTSVVTMCVFIL